VIDERDRGAWFAVSKGNEGAPSNGELMIVIERKISGRIAVTANVNGDQRPVKG